MSETNVSISALFTSFTSAYNLIAVVDMSLLAVAACPLWLLSFSGKI